MRYPLGSFPQYGYQARNATIRRQVAHGALSPKKVEQWGLAEAFKQLPQALFKIDAAIFEVLGA
jgi:hypothetical protein